VRAARSGVNWSIRRTARSALSQVQSARLVREAGCLGCRPRWLQDAANGRAAPDPSPLAGRTSGYPLALFQSNSVARQSIWSAMAVIRKTSPRVPACDDGCRDAGKEAEMTDARIVERTFGWINRSRRLAKAFEALVDSSLAWFMVALDFLLIRRIARDHKAGETVAVWRRK
jgi:hypothetical protein